MLHEGEAALCGHCGEVLFMNRPRSLSRAVGFSSAALIFMVLTHSFPFLTMEAAGNQTRLGLLQSAHALLQDGAPLLALLTLVFTVIAPITLALGLLYLCGPLMSGRSLPGARLVARWIQLSEPWSMLEVFLLGFIVSLLKLGHVADIRFEVGLWALVAVVVCLTAAVAGIDRRELWDRLELTFPETPPPP